MSRVGAAARRFGGLALLAGASLHLAGCARPVAPAGGPVPETPLRVVGSSPERLAVVPPFTGSVTVQFERSVSERLAGGGGSIQDAVIISPRTGNPSISAGGNSLEISLEGGFRPDMVYRVTVLPRFQDRFQNRMGVAYDLVFSTGPDLPPNLIAGVVTNRLTLGPLSGVRVDANTDGGEFPYTAITDSTGVFTFPHIPQGRYNLVAYLDENRNRRPDFTEAQESLALGINDGDTLIVTDLAIHEPDTTAAVLQEVSIQDSLSLVVGFDDYIDPLAVFDEVEAVLSREGANAPEVVEILHPHQWRARNADDSDPPAGQPAPSQEIVLVLSRPLLDGVTYQLSVSGVPNIREVGGGGGEIEVDGPPVRPATPAPAEGPPAGEEPSPAEPLDPPA